MRKRSYTIHPHIQSIQSCCAKRHTMVHNIHDRCRRARQNKNRARADKAASIQMTDWTTLVRHLPNPTYNHIHRSLLYLSIQRPPCLFLLARSIFPVAALYATRNLHWCEELDNRQHTDAVDADWMEYGCVRFWLWTREEGQCYIYRTCA